MEDFSYIEELTILAVVGSLLVTAKIAACCFSLGLHTSHKHINQRQDSLSIAKLNNLKLQKVSEPQRLELVTCDCKSSTNPRRNFPVQPKVTPKLNIPVKILVCEKIESAESHSQDSKPQSVRNWEKLLTWIPWYKTADWFLINYQSPGNNSSCLRHQVISPDCGNLLSPEVSHFLSEYFWK